ncbi:hypothetical protein LTR66_007130 [Elasticomyces elasticus]|nr:hypothetical protein LTR66_007130 [Elasticomyces elasticus]
MRLTFKAARQASAGASDDNTGSSPVQGTRSSSPERPQYSPITPHAQPATLAAVPYNGRYIEPDNAIPTTVDITNNTAGAPSASTYIVPNVPPNFAPVVFPPGPDRLSTGGDSTDAIALRATISILQLQKMRAQKDMRTLEQIRDQALADPEAFRRDLLAGKLKDSNVLHIVGNPSTLQHTDVHEDPEDAFAGAGPDLQEERLTNSHTREVADSQATSPAFTSFATTSDSSRASTSHQLPQSAFPSIPSAQNIVRMPQINWEKYHILGGALESLHDEQLEKLRAQPIAASYSPFANATHDGGAGGQQTPAGQVQGRKDSGTVQEHPMQTRKGSKKVA